MKELITVFDFISNNQLVSTLVAAALLGLLAWGAKRFRDRRDSKRIYEFLRQSRLNTDFRFRSTEAISSATKIPEARIERLCSRHNKIKRNEKEKQSWQLIE
jgi:hypothetical protein